MKREMGCMFAVLYAALSPAGAQQYPSKTVRMVVGFPPGGGTDIVGRIVGQKLSELLAQPILVDNRGGAAGQIAAEFVAKAPPDGYTLMMAHIAAMSILPSIVANLPYDPQRDFAPVSLVAISPNLLVVHPSLPVKSVRQLIMLARASPGQLRYASTGTGTVQHLAGEYFKLQTGADILNVPYKGSGQSIVDLMAGEVQIMFDSVPPVIHQVRQGRLRALAVTSAKRSALLPEIPTVNEGGVAGFDMSTWWGVVAPAAVNAKIVGRLSTETIKLLKLPEVKERLATVGAEALGTTSDVFARHISIERAKYARVVTAANIRVD